MPRFLIAPDKFKGSLTASEAAAAIAAGVKEVYPDSEIDLCPIADGGEGFMETLAPTLNGRWIKCPAVDALGREINSRYLLSGSTAILEMAETAGLWRLAASERIPLVATTMGVGQQMAHAIREHHVLKIILGLGGSATNDGGCGMATALGVIFEKVPAPIPSNLTLVSNINSASRLPLPEIIAACDVDNPLLGPNGATAVFSRQKGASDEDQIAMEAALSHLVKISGGEESARLPGAGAAGGLGFGLLHFAGARLVSGFDLLADLLDMKARIAAADLVITGEGSLDLQSLSGKGPVALARMALALGKPCIGYCGRSDAAVRDSGVFQEIHALADLGLPMETLISRAAPLLTKMVSNSKCIRRS